MPRRDRSPRHGAHVKAAAIPLARLLITQQDALRVAFARSELHEVPRPAK